MARCSTSSGAVVGINSQIYSNSGGYQGVSFAIPIGPAETGAEQIVKIGKVEHGRLGVHVQAVDQSLAGLASASTSPAGAPGCRVSSSDSAAAQAGLKAGDVILKFNGETVGILARALDARQHRRRRARRRSSTCGATAKVMELTAKIRSADEGPGGLCRRSGWREPGGSSA